MRTTVYYTEANGLAKLSSRAPPGPSKPVVVEYMDEGGANLVFKILPYKADYGLPERLKSRLLRIRKNVRHVRTTVEQHQAFHENFADLFPSHHLIEHELVQLDDGIPHLLNEALKQQLVRPSQRKQDFSVLDERYGLLVTDMSPQAGEILLQLKPKWLSQSPNAPANAKRCRTCALRAQRASQLKSTATDLQASCPLALVAERIDDRRRAAVGVTADRRLQDYLVSQALPLLRNLRENQLLMDKKGVLHASDADTIFDLCKAMTLRDCTLFVRRYGCHIEARLGDLDFKHPERLAKWKEAEQSLIRDGWYTNTENKNVWVHEAICSLSR